VDPEKTDWLGRSYNKTLPLRRMAIGKDGARTQTHPDAKEHHPWYEKRVAIREKQGLDDWLSSDFFFRAFCEAVKNGQGDAGEPEKIDFDMDDYFDFRYNDDWRDKDPKDVKLSRRGGVLYQEPAGWKRFAIKCKDMYDFELGKDRNKWMDMSGEPGEWAVAYHGTAMKNVPLIIDNGFRAGGSADVVKDCEDTRTGKPCGPGAIFCTPNLIPVECYANGNEDVASDQKDAAAEIDGHTLFFAFQCRVRPSAIRRPSRHFALNNDEEVMGPRGVFEWVVNSPNDIRPYAILVRDKAGSDHRALKELIAVQ